MTNAELLAKIKAEIERLIEESDFDESANLYSLLSFLSTLESEKPMNQEGFSKEFDDYFLPKNREQKGRWGFAKIYDLARHFAQWQREQMMKEAVEAEILLTPYPTIWLDDCKDYDFKDGQKVRVIFIKEN